MHEISDYEAEKTKIKNSLQNSLRYITLQLIYTLMSLKFQVFLGILLFYLQKKFLFSVSFRHNMYFLGQYKLLFFMEF